MNYDMVAKHLYCSRTILFVGGMLEPSGPVYLYAHIWDYIFCRWPKPNCMMVSISAHCQLQSLIEIAGLQAAPQSVAVQNLDGTMIYMEEVLSISELRKQEHGYYWTELHHRLIILPNTTGRYGHIVYLYF